MEDIVMSIIVEEWIRNTQMEYLRDVRALMLEKALIEAPVGANDGSIDDDMKLCTRVVIQKAE